MRLVSVRDRNGAQVGVQPRCKAAVRDPVGMGQGLIPGLLLQRSIYRLFPCDGTSRVGRSIR